MPPTFKPILEGAAFEVFPNEVHGNVTYYASYSSPTDVPSDPTVINKLLDDFNGNGISIGAYWPKKFQLGLVPQWLVDLKIGFSRWSSQPRLYSMRPRNSGTKNQANWFVDCDFRGLPVPKDEFGNGSQQRQTDQYIAGNGIYKQIQLAYTMDKIYTGTGSDQRLPLATAKVGRFFPCISRLVTGYFWADTISDLMLQFLNAQWSTSINNQNFIFDNTISGSTGYVYSDKRYWMCNSVSMSTMDSMIVAITAEFLLNIDSWDSIVGYNIPFSGQTAPLTDSAIAGVRQTLTQSQDGSVSPKIENGIGKFPLYTSQDLNVLVYALLTSNLQYLVGRYNVN